jgi:hypothetical protein
MKTACHRNFSKRLASGLTLLTACIVLNASLLYGEGSDDALFIDKQGNVGIGTSQPATKLDVEGTVNAKEFKGDGTYLTVEREGSLKEALDKKLDKSGGTMHGDLGVDSAGAITIPSGTTAQRPTSPQNGALRYNTTAKLVEVFVDELWFQIETTPYMGGNVEFFEHTGADQKFTVPEGVTKIFVKAWGAGGAGGTKGGWSHGSNGGGGGFSRGVLTVTPGEVLTIVVGSGGTVHQTAAGYGGGGAATINSVDNRYCGGGGGRSAVVGKGGKQLIVAGGGGGGGSTKSGLFWGKGNSGGAGGGLFGENGYSQYDEKHSFGGKGGGPVSAGQGGWDKNRKADNNHRPGGAGEGPKGGNITWKSYGGGGGGGWKGGGSGGFSQQNTMGGGGGGSGYIKNASYAITMTGKRRECPMQHDPDYIPGVGIGGQDALAGGNGLVVIRR